MDFKNEIANRSQEAEQIVRKYLPVGTQFDNQIIEAMNYSVCAGGKRLRPVLIESFYKLFQGNTLVYQPFMAAMELLHTYSLVHDDLPALDNDDYRRGILTTHKKFGESTAILSGDGLLHQSFEVMLKAFELGDNTQNIISAIKIFSKKTGLEGMFGGQALDVLHTGLKINQATMNYIYAKKTGALIEGSMMIGAILAGADQVNVDQVEKIGYLIGMAFQIKDDLLDINGDSAILGKPTLSDEKNNKQTYVTLHGIQQAEIDLKNNTSEAITILNNIGTNDVERLFLTDLLYYLTLRDK